MIPVSLIFVYDRITEDVCQTESSAKQNPLDIFEARQLPYSCLIVGFANRRTHSEKRIESHKPSRTEVDVLSSTFDRFHEKFPSVPCLL